VGPDEEALRADLKSAAFRMGARRGKWELAKIKFPLVYFRVAVPPRPGSPPWLLLMTNCSGYRAQAPTAQLWNGPTDTPLEESLRPRDPGGVLIAFKNWGNCLYHPIDRIGRGHWQPHEHVDISWRADSDITHFLETVHGLIDVPSLVGVAAPDTAAFLPPDPVDTSAGEAA
jgi:hypothetical protein